MDPSALTSLDPSVVDPGAWWASLQGGDAVVLALLELALGLVVCFYGFRVFRAALTIAGFVAGAWAGATLATGGLSAGGASTGNLAQQAPLGGWLLTLALGVAGALLAWALYRLGGLLLGAALGVVVLGSIGSALGATTDVQWLLLLLAVVLGALAGWRLQTLAVVIGTALAGATGAVSAAVLLVQRAGVDTGVPPGAPAVRLPGARPPLSTAEWVVFALTVALAALGALRQLRGRRRSAHLL